MGTRELSKRTANDHAQPPTLENIPYSEESIIKSISPLLMFQMLFGKYH